MPPSVLVIEDDELTRETLSLILKSNDYNVTNTSGIDQAIALLKNRGFDVIIMAGKLLGKDQTRLQSLDNFSSQTIKIILTAYPSALTTVQALTLGADAYIVKPIDPEELLKSIRTKLDNRLISQDRTSSEGGNWPNIRASQKFNATEFQQYLESMAEELVSFGLTANQAKVYVALVAVEPAPASKIASACCIRREEVYRILPNLVDIGIVTKKIGNPINYLAVTPESAIQLLMKLKLKEASEELNKLNTKSDGLISKLKKAEPSSFEETKSIECIATAESFFDRFLKANEHVNSSIDTVMSSEFLRYTQINFGYLIKEFRARAVKCRIITETNVLSGAEDFARMTKDPDFLELQVKGVFGLKTMDSLPFNAVIFDEKEAIWGKFKFKEEGCNLWSNYPSHVKMLKVAFDALWQKAKPLQEV